MKKTLIIALIIFIVLIIFGLVTSYIDSARVRNSIEPKFTIKIISENGNKVTYWGLGYKVVMYPSISPNEPYKNKRASKYGGWFMSYNLERYDKMKMDIDKEIERYLYFISPNCSAQNSGGLLTHKTLVYNNGFDKEKLLDVDNKSYCKVYAKYKCVKDGEWQWNSYISCKDYEDKGYKDWDTAFEIKK